MGRVSIPPTVFYAKTTFNGGIVSNQPASGTEALKLVGANGLFQILQIFDYLGNPIQATNTAGGDSIFGDRRSVYTGGDIFNPVFQILGATGDNLASTAGGFKVGHSAGQTAVYVGTGAPGAAYPVTTGIPANGTFYLRQDGGASTTIYQVRTGAWAGIV